MIVADRFTVQDTLGAGGSAVVYRAHDEVLDRLVALKLLGETESSQVDQSRFEREIKLTARLVRPAIVPLFDSGWHEGRLYYVMPCIEGTTLRALLAEQGRLPTAQALRLAGDVAEALAYAHASGVVHRDIKPENIFSAAGRALVADFGIARAMTVDADRTALTEHGIAIGTVAYMSPEQAMGERELDGRADLYSLGCVLFELLTGEPVFRGATSMNVLAQHLTADPRVAERLPDAPPSLVRLLEQLLAKERDERPATAVELVVAFHALATSSGASSAESSTRALTASPVASPEPSGATEESEADRAVSEARKLFGRGVQGGDGAESVLALGKVFAEKALALEPRHVLAMAVLADIVICQGFRGFADEKESAAESERIRLAAAAIDDNVGELQSSIGVARLYWHDDFHGAQRYLQRGAELSPDDGIAQRMYSAWLKMAGRFDEALARMERAVALMPDSPHAFVGLADTLMSMGRYVEAIAPLQQALRILPRYPQAMERLEMAAHRAGRIDEAYSSRRSLLGTQRLFARLDRLTEVMEKDGWATARRQDLEAELQELLALAATENPFRDRHTSRHISDAIIIASGELGEWTRAMDWVERGYYVRPGRLIRVLTDLPFDRRGLASDRRYARLLRTAGLEFLL